MYLKFIRFFFLLVIVGFIGFMLFLFGTPRLKEYLNEKNDIIGMINIKLQIVESITSADQPQMQNSANVTMNKYALMKKELCKKEYFYLKSNCELSQMNKSNLRELNTLLETGIQEIVEIQNTGLE